MNRLIPNDAAGFWAKLRTEVSSIRVCPSSIGTHHTCSRMIRGSGVVSRTIPCGRYHRRAADGGWSSTRDSNANPYAVSVTVRCNRESRCILDNTKRPMVVRWMNGRCGKSSMFSMARVQ